MKRICSIMGNTWTDNLDNRMRFELVKVELCIKPNFVISCGEFFEFIKTLENSNLVKAAMSNKKYTSKNK